LTVLKLQLAYDGTSFAGWQVQPRRRTVQGTLESALARILDRPVRVAGSGRTDAGVHARGQVASAEVETGLDEERLRLGLNALLPDDLRLLALRFEPPGFHARRSARGKEYRYEIAQGEILSPFLARYRWHYRRRLDEKAMNLAAAAVVGRHDFSSFVSAGGQAGDHHREVRLARFDRGEAGDLVFRIEADGFLYRMVRNLVGTLVEVGRGRRAAAEMPTLIEARDRRLAGPTAPARGLFLQSVHYPVQAAESEAGP
jgi:tRNA pseudouridine38-40 synthase